MTWLHLFGMLLIVATVVLTLTGGAAILVSLARKRWQGIWIACALAVWWVLHLGLVALVSASQPERRLPPGEVKRFCGFYLDCHIGAAVVGARRIGSKEIVTLEISSTARAASLTPYGLTAYLVDDSGRRYAPEPTGPLEQPLAPGGSYRKDLVFEVPDSARALALDVRERGFPDDFLESLLPGDDDSLLHRGTSLLLPPA